VTEFSLKALRILPELRAVQVERHLASEGVEEVLYFDLNPDISGTPIPSSCHKVSFFRGLRAVWASDADLIDVPEALWIRFSIKNLLIVVVWRLATIVRRTPRAVVAYAIENNDLDSLVTGGRRSLRPLIPLVKWLVIHPLLRMTTRIAFGTAAAQSAYADLPGVASVERSMIPALPAAALHAEVPLKVNPPEALFMGRMERRKGLELLERIWPLVERDMPDIRLTLIGDGPLAARIEAWCEQDDRRSFIGFLPHHEATALLRSKSVLIALSVSDGRWKEQIGLPIVEALANGVPVISTPDTGLAQWLQANGHLILRLEDDFPASAAKISSYIRNLPGCEEVLAALPREDGRERADVWLHSARGQA
jgi:glycosyltransferase involved in cell wall biosynthesis